MFILLKSLAMSADVAKELMKQRAIDEIQAMVSPLCKNEKDIKFIKHWLCSYTGMLAAFATTEDGQKSIIKCKPVFDFCLFVLDSVTPPQQESTEITPLNQLMMNMLLFLRNTSFSKSNKLIFTSDKAFLPCLLAFISSRHQHPRVRAYTVALLWAIVFNNQQIKATINTENVRNELQLIQSEYQRHCDISQYAHYVTRNATKGEPEAHILVNKTQEVQRAGTSR